MRSQVRLLRRSSFFFARGIHIVCRDQMKKVCVKSKNLERKNEIIYTRLAHPRLLVHSQEGVYFPQVIIKGRGFLPSNRIYWPSRTYSQVYQSKNESCKGSPGLSPIIGPSDEKDNLSQNFLIHFWLSCLYIRRK